MTATKNAYTLAAEWKPGTESRKKKEAEFIDKIKKAFFEMHYTNIPAAIEIFEYLYLPLLQNYRRPGIGQKHLQEATETADKCRRRKEGRYFVKRRRKGTDYGTERKEPAGTEHTAGG